MQPALTSKKLIRACLIAVVLLLAIGIYRYLSAASVTVTTDNPDDTVTIGRVHDNKVDPKDIRSATHKLNAHVRPGVYQITVLNHANAVTRMITLKGWQHKAYVLSLEVPAPVENVLGQDVGNVLADSSRLYFIDNKSGNLMKISSPSVLQKVDAPFTISDIKWASDSIGVAKDVQNNLYLFKNGSLQNIALPFPTNIDSRLSYTVNKDGVLYVSNNGSIYRGSLAGGFTKIYTSSQQNLTLSATAHRLAILYTPQSQEGESAQDTNSIVTVLSENGSKVSSNKDMRVYKLSWSDDGEHLLAKGDDGLVLFNKSLGNKVSIPVRDIGDFSWISKDSFVYSDKNTLWKYNIAGKNAQQISDQASGVISAVYPSQDGSYIYLVSERGDSNGNVTGNILSRVSIKGKNPSRKLASLSIYLPETAGSCIASYINFGNLSLILYYPPGLEPSDCVKPVQDLLKYYGLEIPQANFQFIPLAGSI